MDSKLILCMTVIKSAKKLLSFFATSRHNNGFYKIYFSKNTMMAYSEHTGMLTARGVSVKVPG